jgi:ATP-dependent HslUV protease ATP-binding subunit HslU
LVEPQFNLLFQHSKLLETEGVNLHFTEDGISKIAAICWQMNQQNENIGARRVRTVVSKVLEQISFAANESQGQEVVIDAEFVEAQVKPLVKKIDLLKYIL